MDMRSSNVYGQSVDFPTTAGSAGVHAVHVATPKILVHLSEPNVAPPADSKDETQSMLPIAEERVWNGHNAVCTITEENDLVLQSRLEALTCANRRKDEFLAMLSHELSSPLAAIHHAVRIMESEGGVASTQHRMQALVKRQLIRMAALVEELRDVSRIASGHLHLQRERVDLRDIVGRAIETLEWELKDRAHRLSVELPGAPVWLRADPRRLEQVFVNLLANASRYTDAGGQLALRVQVMENEAIILVRDSGIGIAPESLPHIFELFKQGNAAEARSGSGLGVGLAVVRNLVELHRGSVIAASAGIGQGSEFTVRLPTGE
jgi:signal transduction histidine kinase